MYNATSEDLHIDEMSKLWHAITTFLTREMKKQSRISGYGRPSIPESAVF